MKYIFKSGLSRQSTNYCNDPSTSIQDSQTQDGERMACCPLDM